MIDEHEQAVAQMLLTAPAKEKPPAKARALLKAARRAGHVTVLHV